MSQSSNYDFCPKCGALMQDGVCQSCGHGRVKIQWKPEDGGSFAEAPRKKKRSQKGLLIFLVCFILVVILFCTAAFWGVMRFSESLEAEAVPEYESDEYVYNMPYADSWNDDAGYYVPDEDDEYYVEITDATRLDLSYQIIWKSVSIHADDPNDGRMFDCIYPALSGENAFDYTWINRQIEDMVCAYENVYRDYEYGVMSYAYVTYMDEEKISVAVQHTLDDTENYAALLDAMTFRLNTGKEIPKSEMHVVDDELVRFFRARDTQQNGTVDFVENATDEELKSYLSNPEKNVIFYTPVGLEIGFNYDSGWVTVTLKNDTL